VPSKPAPLPEKLADAVEAQVYIYGDPSGLDMKLGLWTFEQFVQENAWKWVGEEADKREDIILVDKVRDRLLEVQGLRAA
jgi:hypothetical protein